MPLRVKKGPSASYTHTVDFSGWAQLTEDGGQALASATATASPSGLTIGFVTVDADEDEVLIPLSGGTLGVTYRVTILATTDGVDVLDEYLDVLITTDTADGAVVWPSQLGPYVDTVRAVELLYDDAELQDDDGNETDPPPFEEIDSNERAFNLTQAAWRDILRACRRGNIYQHRELIDLANDPVRGQDLIELVADLFWFKLVKRRRHPKGEPQNDPEGRERVEAVLEQLRQGERIFDLTGVAVTDEDGNLTGAVYENELGTATAMTRGRFGATDRVGRDRRFWGCVNDDQNDPGNQGGYPYGGIGGCC